MTTPFHYSWRAAWVKTGLVLALAAVTLQEPPVCAQQPITIPNSAVVDLHSKINDTGYKLFIITPRSYAVHPGRRYPVFYLLDGNDTAAIAWLTRSRQHSDAEEVIFVGIGYPEPLAGPPIPLPGKPAVAPAQRSADYAIYNTVEPWSPPKDKGAPVFLKVIEQEIIPYVDSHYRTNPLERALGGHSLGGLFTTYALFHTSGIFDKFWIGSPSLLWDRSICFQYEAEYAAAHHDLRARVIADAGGEESKTFMRDPLFKMMDAVKARHYPHLAWKTIVLPNEDHGTLPIAGMPQVLDFLYGPPAAELSAQEKKAIVGDWRLPGDKVSHFAYEGDLLFATGLPFLSNTDPAREQLITPLSGQSFELRTMLDINLGTDSYGKPQLTIHKMRSNKSVIASRAKSQAAEK
jgi:predicted alpha/beta superfamily hydrolase